MTILNDRFWSKVKKTETCWIGVAGADDKGYGRFRFEGKNVHAYRLAWIDQNGPVPEGLQLDHLCRVRLCVRHSHLEPVTPAENVARGEGVTAQHSRQNLCKNGHPFTFIRLGRRGAQRVCAICKNERERRYYADKRAVT